MVLLRRSLEEQPETRYHVSNGEEGTPLKLLALVACRRHRVTEFIEDGNGHLGMAKYKPRLWIGWHHLSTLVGQAHQFVAPTQRRLTK